MGLNLKRRMTILERQKLRQDILERELAKARKRAAESGLTMICRSAMEVTGSDPAKAREWHANCVAEEAPRGAGCLCLCHDTITGSVETAKMEEIPLPLEFE